MTRRPKLLIIVLFQNLAEEGRVYYARAPAPPLTGALLAGLTPPVVEVELLHEMVRPIDYETDAEIVALSFMDFCAPHAYEVAARFRALGKRVIAGGRYPTSFPEQVLPHFDAVVVGEAEGIWPTVVRDAVEGRLQHLYRAPPAGDLRDIPPPRYDLVEPEFAVPVVTEATRGCPYRCSFCQLSVTPTPYRRRPIPDVIRDLETTRALPFTKRRVAMLYDNNLGGDLDYAKALLREIARLDLWALGVQFSFDCLHDDEFVDLLAQANCRMAFVGMESLNEPSLAAVHKRQNRVSEYAALFAKLKSRGILIFAGLMVGFDEDTTVYYDRLPDLLEGVEPSAVLTSIAIPIPGTPLFRKLEREQRIVDPNLAHYEGDHLVFRPRHLTRAQLLVAYATICRRFYSWPSILGRFWRLIVAQWRRGSFLDRVFRSLLLSGIYFALTRFQRHHARTKVFPLANAHPALPPSRAPALPLAEPNRPGPTV
jgi:radical SAM superfamily enzyme YgiQ (UPF0313 family)